MLNKKSIDDLKNLKGRRVLVRCDFNIPIKGGEIRDYTRIDEEIPTVKKLLDEGARVILCSHLGKAKGKPDPELSLAPVAEALSDRLPGSVVSFADDSQVTGDITKKLVSEMEDGDVVLLQNTRFRPEEELYAKDKSAAEGFARELAELSDGIFVDDAFGTAHREHCSNVGVARFCRETAVGYLMEKEIHFLGDAVSNPNRPFAAILGGAKVSDKIKVIEHLLDEVDILIIGGGMAYTFLKAQGHSIGKSLCEDDKLEYALDMIEKAKKNGVQLLLPIDHVEGAAFAADTERKVVKEIEDGRMGMDIGPETIELYTKALTGAKTVVWNGPMGVFEWEAFENGTLGICKAVAQLKDATTVVGGGDSVNAVTRLGYADRMTHISTGGGASLQFLEGRELPGIAAVEDLR